MDGWYRLVRDRLGCGGERRPALADSPLGRLSPRPRGWLEAVC